MKEGIEMKKLIVSFVLTLLVFTLRVQAQMSSTADFLRMNPTAITADIASQIPYSSYVAFGNISCSLQNSGLYYDNLFRFDNEGYPVAVNLNQALLDLQDDGNWLNTDVSIDFLNCGLRTKPGLFTFSYRFRVQGTTEYSKDVIQILAEGNASFLGDDNPARLDISTDTKAFQEFAFGYQANLGDNVTVGARVKLLTGVANVKAYDMNATLYTDSTTYALRAYENIDMYACLPNEVSFENGDFTFSTARPGVGSLFRNFGLGFDLGATYTFNGNAGITAAVNDLGFIKWRKNTLHVTGEPQNVGQYYENGSLYFDGFEVHQLKLLINDENYREQFLDTVSQYLGLEGESGMEYVTNLNASFLLGGYYDINDVHRVAARVQGYYSGLGLKPALTLAYNANFNKNVDLAVSYTMMEQSIANLGLGFGVNIMHLYVYAATNNILSVFNPLNVSNFNFKVGLAYTGRVTPKKVIVDDSGSW